ncbi:FAD-dependent oxidoreductase [Aquibium microcysteis]|uniref:FAD-dependent oxidoreductase n=1 Tax=Aquibium microcysteis TaxID=675281 RepID=UPI00165CEE31|nr:FAD-dependent oxidoreductase [Aquibium microcysteis]
MAAHDRMQCDLIVIGGGMAGMTAAARAAEAGARVVVVEKAPAIGGSALLSGGFVWTATSRAQMDRHDDGDPALHAVVVEEFPHVMEWLRGRVETGPPVRVLYGRGQQIDIAAYMRGCVASVEAAGGFVVPDTQVTEIIMRGGRVAGALTAHADGETELEAEHLLVATGGAQADPDLRARMVHLAARSMRLRSNPHSDGGGHRLAIAAGGAMAGPNAGFYGHLLARGCPMRGDSDFVRFTQYHSIHGVLLNGSGKRFCDESFDDHSSAQLTLRQPGAAALLVLDARAQREFGVSAPVAGAEPIDRHRLAMEAGCPGGVFDTIEEIGAFASSIGYDGAACIATLLEYNRHMKSGPEQARPPRESNGRALEEAPWYVLEVDSAITFTFGGLSTDTRARALDAFGEPIPGLYVAGADVGNVYRKGYAGGLALAATFAFRALRTAGLQPTC